MTQVPCNARRRPLAADAADGAIELPSLNPQPLRQSFGCFSLRPCVRSRQLASRAEIVDSAAAILATSAVDDCRQRRLGHTERARAKQLGLLRDV